MEEPLIDVVDYGTHLVIEVALPGVLETDIDVFVERARLVIRAERPEESGTFLVRELRRGLLERTLDLPFDAELSAATYEEGVLRLRLARIGGA